MAVTIQPVIKLLNHRIRLAVGAELVAMLGVTLESCFAGCFLDDGILFHPQIQSRIDAAF